MSENQDRPLAGVRVVECATALGLAAFGIIFMFGALKSGVEWDSSGPQPGYMPFWLSVIIISASLMIFFRALKKTGNSIFLTNAQAFRVILFYIPIIVLILLSQIVGMYASIYLYLLYMMAVRQDRTIYTVTFLPAGVVLGSYVIFEIWFGVPLLKGPFEEFLGIW